MEEITIQRKTGKNLRTVMSRLLVKDYYEAIKELVSNSYDEDAEVVNLTYDSLENKLVIEDDGHGMSESGLEDFYRLGDSVKVDSPISPKGRRRIGKFGIATVLLEFLAESYKLETWQNGKKVTVDEDFSHKSEEGLEYKVEQREDNSTGTKITLRNLKFTEGPQFQLWRLKRSLAWELPHSPDFKIYFNDEELSRKNDPYVAEFQYEEELPNAGLVKALFYYFQKKPVISGIYVYVNKRSYGDSSYFDLHKIKRNLVDRVLGLVDADGLQEHISFDRSRFKEDNPSFNEVRVWVYSKLREVSKSVRIKSELEIADKLRTALPKSIEALKETLATIQEAEPVSEHRRIMRRQPSYRTQLTQSRRELEVSGFHLVDRGKDDSMASIDEDKRELLFNLNHPFYEAASMGNPSSIQHHLLVTTAYTKAEHIFVSKRGSEANFLKRRTELFGEYCKRVFSGDSVVDMLSRASPTDTEGFIPFRLYKQREVTGQQIPLPTLRKLVRSGLVVPKGKELYLGKELNEYLAMLEGYVPAMDIMVEYGMTLDVVKERRRQLRENINNLLVHYEGILPFIKNIGVDEPFFLVQEDKVDAFLGLYTKGTIRVVKHMDRHFKRHPELLQQQFEEDRFVSLYELGKIIDTKLDDLLQIFSFSQIRGKPIGISTENKTEKYSLRDFFRVNNEYRGGASG